MLPAMLTLGAAVIQRSESVFEDGASNLSAHVLAEWTVRVPPLFVKKRALAHKSIVPETTGNAYGPFVWPEPRNQSSAG